MCVNSASFKFKMCTAQRALNPSRGASVPYPCPCYPPRRINGDLTHPCPGTQSARADHPTLSEAVQGCQILASDTVVPMKVNGK